jgi:hypothetical protein
MPVPSPTRTPSARRSKGRMQELRLSARNWQNSDQSTTSWAWWTPPASIRSLRPEASSRTAWSTATSEEAQAASTV